MNHLAIVAVLSLAAGLFSGWYVTKSGYTAKLKAIAGTVGEWEGHYSQEVRTFAARLKALL